MPQKLSVAKEIMLDERIAATYRAVVGILMQEQTANKFNCAVHTYRDGS